jgi:LEA14-like dessication related protein
MKRLITSTLLLVLIASCKDVKEPTFEQVENLKIGKPGLSETDLSVDLRFNNSNSFGMRIKSVDCDLYLDSVFAGHFTNSQPVSIKANQSFVIPFSGKAQTMIMVQQSSKAFQGKESYIKVQGSARVGRSGLFKTIPVLYTDTLLLSNYIKF